MEENVYQMVIAVVNQGYSEEVMNAARGAGARGGTVIHTRRISDEKTVSATGLGVQEEQELILLLGRELGTLDLEEQVRALQHCLDQWRQHIEGLECQKEPHGRLCRGVGVSVGVFLAILLL